VEEGGWGVGGRKESGRKCSRSPVPEVTGLGPPAKDRRPRTAGHSKFTCPGPANGWKLVARIVGSGADRKYRYGGIQPSEKNKKSTLVRDVYLDGRSTASSVEFSRRIVGPIVGTRIATRPSMYIPPGLWSLTFFLARGGTRALVRRVWWGKGGIELGTR
jgi:hypothetical protein